MDGKHLDILPNIYFCVPQKKEKTINDISFLWWTIPQPELIKCKETLSVGERRLRVWECIILYMLRKQALHVMESSYLECSPIQPVIKRSFTRKLFKMCPYYNLFKQRPESWNPAYVLKGHDQIYIKLPYPWSFTL